VAEDSTLTDIRIRPATPTDEDGVLALYPELFEPPGLRPPDYSIERAREGYREFVGSDHADVLLAVRGGRIVGLASVCVDIRSVRYGLRCWLEDLVVTSGERSKGVGRALLAAASAWARERGCTHLELDSGLARADAHRFYEANGMTRESYVFGLRLAP
jgi:GNAT superfamily N-acetyltransferase